MNGRERRGRSSELNQEPGELGFMDYFDLDEIQLPEPPKEAGAEGVVIYYHYMVRLNKAKRDLASTYRDYHKALENLAKKGGEGNG